MKKSWLLLDASLIVFAGTVGLLSFNNLKEKRS